MCGIAGFLDTSKIFKYDRLYGIAVNMANTLVHRGPDDSGAWVDEKSGIAMGHRRLSIIDLSSAGHQPMISSCGRYVIVFNGEIYNFHILRLELENSGCMFRGHSDTEVMLAAISQWGPEKALKRFNGMFAFALWDRKEKILYLTRDRIGEKPLYYGWLGKTFMFASEIKALRQHPHFQPEIDRDALALYVRYGCVPTPHCIYKGIYKLLPGTLLAIRDSHPGFLPGPIAYWSAKQAGGGGVKNTLNSPTEEIIEQLDGLLRDAVKLRMEADVPLGVFLSGGIDSSTIAALMQAQNSRPIKTFTIGYHDDNYNEAKNAKAIAGHLGAEHTELYVMPKEALAVIPRLPEIYDEPFSDSSQIPTFIVSALTRRYVTVALSGDGGDEVFGGYNRYSWGRTLWSGVSRLPYSLRSFNAKLLTSLSQEAWDRAFKKISPLLPKRMKQRMPGYKLHKLAEIMTIDNPGSLYCKLISQWDNPCGVVNGAVEPLKAASDISQWGKASDFVEKMMYFDLIGYLPDDILVKVDRASMACSLETRIPYLDHRVEEFLRMIPLSIKMCHGQTKWLLRQVLYKYVPRHLVERPKMGFGVPVGLWLRGPLKEWAETLLSERRLEQEGYLNPAPIREAWQLHLSGRYDRTAQLWAVLMFQAWLEKAG